MDEQKQIDEMAKVIIKAGESYYKMPVDIECANREAGELYEAGYRKQSDTARDIIKDILWTVENCTKGYLREHLRELAEKYGVKID